MQPRSETDACHECEPSIPDLHLIDLFADVQQPSGITAVHHQPAELYARPHDEAEIESFDVVVDVIAALLPLHR